jgi:hypothetical protein
LGRAAAGDWTTAGAAFTDFVQAARPAGVLLVLALLAEHLLPRATGRSDGFPGTGWPVMGDLPRTGGVRCARVGAVVTPPFRVLGPFEPAEHRRLRRRMMFDAFKWDPQVGDTCTIGRFALALREETWIELARSAEALAAETLAAEQELLRRPEWHDELGLPRAIRRVLRDGKEAFPSAAARVIRFDFHHTVDGWRISEANTDVPGGFNEAEGLAGHLARTHPDLEPCGLPAVDLARALAAAVDPSAGVVALVHATAYTDDLQVMLHLERRQRERGGFRRCPPRRIICAMRRGRLELLHAGRVHPVCAAVRFFPRRLAAQSVQARAVGLLVPRIAGALVQSGHGPAHASQAIPPVVGTAWTRR